MVIVFMIFYLGSELRMIVNKLLSPVIFSFIISEIGRQYSCIHSFVHELICKTPAMYQAPSFSEW